MASLSGQRRRRDSLTGPPGVALLRDGLTSRAAGLATSRLWLRAAPEGGASGTDAHILQLGRSIAAALRTVSENAEGARASLREARAALHAAIDTRCNELEASLDAAEATKLAALERELVAADAALEQWRSEGACMGETVAAMTDAELSRQHSTLTEHLDTLEALLLALPPAVIEPPHVGLELAHDFSALLIQTMGRVVAPLAITAADLSLEGTSSVVRPGAVVRLSLSLGPRLASQSAEELEVSLGMLGRLTCVASSLDEVGVALQPLPVTVHADVSQRSLVLAMAVPSSASAAASVCLESLTVGGQPVPGLPLRTPLLRLEGASPDNINALSAKSKVAYTMRKQGSIAEAVALLRAVLLVRERVQGPEHPNVLSTKYELAAALHAMGSSAEAVALLRALLPMQERVRGPEHANVLSTKHVLATVLHSMGSSAEAVTLLRTNSGNSR